MSQSLEDIQTFAKRIREKTGAYSDVPDDELVKRVVEKHPEYRERVALSSTSPTDYTTGEAIKTITPHGNWGAPRDGGKRPHRGIDLRASEGTPYGVAAPARVTYAGPKGRYGNLIEVEYDLNGRKVRQRFGHNKEIKVKVGDTVSPGQLIGLSGQTGNAKGPHIHNEWWENGQSVDPSTVKDVLYPVLLKPSQRVAPPVPPPVPPVEAVAPEGYENLPPEMRADLTSTRPRRVGQPQVNEEQDKSRREYQRRLALHNQAVARRKALIRQEQRRQLAASVRGQAEEGVSQMLPPPSLYGKAAAGSQFSRISQNYQKPAPSVGDDLRSQIRRQVEQERGALSNRGLYGPESQQVMAGANYYGGTQEAARVSAETERRATAFEEQQARDERARQRITPQQKEEDVQDVQRSTGYGNIRRGLDTGFERFLAGLDDLGAGAARILGVAGARESLETSAYRRRQRAGRIEEQAPLSTAGRVASVGAEVVPSIIPAAAATATAGPVGGFAALSALSSAGQGKAPSEVISDAIKGGAVGAVFRSSHGQALFPKVATVGVSTAAIEKAFGASDEETRNASLTNALFAAFTGPKSVQSVARKLPSAVRIWRDGRVEAEVRSDPQGTVRVLSPGRESTAGAVDVEVEGKASDGSLKYRQKLLPPAPESPRATGEPPAPVEPPSRPVPPPTRPSAPVVETQGRPVAEVRVESQPIVQHSDPRIDGGRVIGKTSDGKLKVENNEGGVSIVKNPRTTGNREATIVRRTDESTVEVDDRRIQQAGSEVRPSAGYERTDIRAERNAQAQQESAPQVRQTGTQRVAAPPTISRAEVVPIEEGRQGQAALATKGLTRNFRAGMNDASLTFASETQRDLYDLVAKERYSVRGGQVKTGQRKVGDIQGLRKSLSGRLGVDEAQASNMARAVYDDVRAQMKGVKHLEERRLSDNVLMPKAEPSSRVAPPRTPIVPLPKPISVKREAVIPRVEPQKPDVVKAAPTKAKEPWEMTRVELRARHMPEIEAALSEQGFSGAGLEQRAAQSFDALYGEPGRRAVVSNALQQGKPVPSEVLADYPDLKPNRTEKQTAPTPTPVRQPEPEFTVGRAKYSKGNVAVRATSKTGYKSRAARLAAAIGGRFSNRESAYIMSESKARRLRQLYDEGYDANSFNNELIPPRTTETPAVEQPIYRRMRESQTPLSDYQRDVATERGRVIRKAPETLTKQDVVATTRRVMDARDVGQQTLTPDQSVRRKALEIQLRNKQITRGEFDQKVKAEGLSQLSVPAPVVRQNPKEAELKGLLRNKVIDRAEYDKRVAALKRDRSGEAGFINVSEIASAIKQNGIDILNAPRSLMSSFDLSAPLRQGAILTLTEPKATVAAMKGMFQALVSTQKYNEIGRSLVTDPDFALAEDSGLFLSSIAQVRAQNTGHSRAPSTRLPVRFSPEVYRRSIDRATKNLSGNEEAFMSRIASRIPHVKYSEQAYVAYLDLMRFQAFKKYANALKVSSVNPVDNANEFKGIASFINNATGRGDLGKTLNAAAPVLNAVFFSPRYLASRLNLLNPISYAKLPPEARKIAMKKMLQFSGLVGLALLLATLGGAEVEWDDPESPDWLKAKVGNTRYDFLSGFQQPMRFVYRMSKAMKNTALGVKNDWNQNASDIAISFGRSKLSPVASYLADWMSGKTFDGDKFDPAWGIAERIAPMAGKDFYEAWKEEGGLGILKTTPAVFGVGMQTYSPKEKESKPVRPVPPPRPIRRERVERRERSASR